MRPAGMRLQAVRAHNLFVTIIKNPRPTIKKPRWARWGCGLPVADVAKGNSTVRDGYQPSLTVPNRNVINLRLDREHHKVFRQAFFQKGLPPEAYRKLKLMTLPTEPAGETGTPPAGIIEPRSLFR